MKQACAEDPGVVLADTNAGHYIRYYSDCSVIANNFLLTQQHFQKVDEVGRLFSLSPDEFLEQAPFVKYVLVRAAKIESKADDNFSYAFFGVYQPNLSQQLLLSPADRLPAQFKLLYDVRMQKREGGSQRPVEVPYAKLYKIVRSGMPADSSVNNVSE